MVFTTRTCQPPTTTSVQKYEPEVFKLFKQIKDKERVETTEYSYRLRDGGRFGFSVTRFSKDQQQQQTNTTVDTGAAIRKELRAAHVVIPSSSSKADVKTLASLNEIRKQLNTVLVAVDILVARLDTRTARLKKIAAPSSIVLFISL